MTETPQEARRKRLLYRAKYRGTKEADCLVHAFIKHHLTQNPDTNLDALEALIDMPDPLINDCLLGNTTPPAAQDTVLWQQFVTFYQQFVATSQ